MKSDRGAMAVELALLLPVLLVVLAGVVDLGDVLRVQVLLQDAAQDGVSYAVRHPGDPAQTRQRVLAANTELAMDAVVDCSAGPVVRVRVTHSHDWLTGLLFTQPLGMTAEVHGDVLSTNSCVSG
ncbi:hypothetical protein FKR81_17140 [Lentzea tibetensis]|uniref:TadE-like domain-containing protein n=1 Tax=Lentzea tibetensis TaxID=2591470 RepID=A0A563EUR5_9PSEU|nr:TadE/TadG family type IV pilus assembly protein [Lentzea tibetensis]TWP51332.1 hypothetical protein FKR81_17140 [Lentzea tibetensis]